jgi:hypothetical protein
VQVTFTKVDEKRYLIEIEREHGPALEPRFGPGHDDLMPHDLAHYLVEEHFGIELGVWGQLAAGGGGIFRPAPSDDTGRFHRTARRIAAVGRADMASSEQLTGLVVALWEREIGRRKHRWRQYPGEVDADLLRSAIERLDEIAHRWEALQYGRSMTLVWPRRLAFDAAKSRRGRRRSTRAAPPRRSPTTVTR